MLPARHIQLVSPVRAAWLLAPMASLAATLLSAELQLLFIRHMVAGEAQAGLLLQLQALVAAALVWLAPEEMLRQAQQARLDQMAALSEAPMRLELGML